MGMNPEDFEKMRARVEKNHGNKKTLPVGDQVHNSIIERNFVDEPLAANQGKEKGSVRVLVRITAFRSRLIDPDNLFGKYVTDAARYAGVLSDDSAAHIDYQISQVKVPKGEERTLFEIL